MPRSQVGPSAIRGAGTPHSGTPSDALERGFGRALQGVSDMTEATIDLAIPGIRPAIRDLPPFAIGAIAEYGRAVGDLIPLWFGESDRPTPDFIVAAAIEALRQGHTFYGIKRGDPELRDALAGYMSGLYGRRVTEDRINVTASGISAIAVALQAIVDPGRNVVMLTPVWPHAGRFVKQLGAELREVPLARDEGGWRLDLDRVSDAIDARTSAIFLNSPNNPTGWTAEADELAAILALCRRRGLWLVSDEVYGRLAYGRTVAPSVLHVADPEDRVLIVNSFSKNWSMTGWRLGWLTSPPGFSPELEKLTETQTGGPASFVQRAGITAVRDGEGYIRQMVEGFAAGRDAASRFLAAMPGVRYSPPVAGFYAFFSVEGEADGMALARRMIDEARVGLAPGTAFGTGAADHVRLCFASSAATLERAFERLARSFFHRIEAAL